MTTEVRIKGVTALAKKCRRSKTHISAVLRGQRDPGPALGRLLEKHGVQVPERKVVAQ